MDKIAELMAKLAEQYGPNVVDAARGAAIVEAWSNFEADLVLAGFSAVALLATKRMWHSTSATDMDMNFGKIGAVVCGLIGSITAAVSIGLLCDPWLYTAMIHPDLWIAKRVFHL